MMRKIKILLFLFFVGIGLSGCIVLPDDESMYSSYYLPYYTSYPVGSYEWATDYYHRPPAPKRHHYKHHKSDHRYKDHEHKKHEDKKHEYRSHDNGKHSDYKHVDKKHGDDAKKHDVPKKEVHKEKPSHDVAKKDHNSSLDKKKDSKSKPIHNRMFRHH